MPYIFQEEIQKAYPHKTGNEAFDSMYQLYNIFQEPSYFLINLFFGSDEQLELPSVLSFLKSATKTTTCHTGLCAANSKRKITP